MKRKKYINNHCEGNNVVRVAFNKDLRTPEGLLLLKGCLSDFKIHDFEYRYEIGFVQTIFDFDSLVLLAIFYL